MRNLTAIIPTLNPDDTLVRVVRAIRDDFRHVIVVDDGSTTGRGTFAAVADMGAIVLAHPENRGKGAALKTAFAHVLANLPTSAGVVTVDGDGQHLAEDIRRVADAALAKPDRLILGARAFSGRVPFRSRLGNLWTRAEFRLLAGTGVGDTQSGLRALPRTLLAKALAIPGERYEYEIAMLVAFARRGLVSEVPIATVYEPGNPTSHYRPMADTLLTQRALFAAALGKLT